MRRFWSVLIWIVLAGSILTALVSACALFREHTHAHEQSLGARLEVEPIERELPPKSESGTVEVSFALKNAGNGVLEIFHTNSTCGCVVPRLEKRRLQRGESTNLIARVDQPRSGTNAWAIEVQTNDPQKPNVRLLIRGSGLAEPPYLLSVPPPVTLRSLVGSGSASTEMSFMTCELADTPPWIVGARATLISLETQLNVSRTFAAEDKRFVYRDYSVRVEQKSGTSAEDESGVIELLAKGDEDVISVHQTRVLSAVVNSVSAMPAVIALSVKRNGPLPEGRFLVVGNQPNVDFAIESVSLDHDWVRVAESAEKSQGRVHKFEAKLGRLPDTLPAEAKATLVTSIPDCPQIVVRVVVFEAD